MINAVTCLLISLGTVFFLGVSVGVLRFPDFYTRIHAAAKGDTLSTLLLLSGFALYNLRDSSAESMLVAVKIMFVVLFVSITSPTSSHALIDAGYETGRKPWQKKGPDTE